MQPRALSYFLEFLWKIIFLHPITCPVFWTLVSSNLSLGYRIMCVLISLNGFILGKMRRKVVKDWKQEVVVITGGSSGIGLELANILKFNGATIIIVDIQPVSGFRFYKCDISDRQQVTKVCQEIRNEFQVTMLVNNAGISC